MPDQRVDVAVLGGGLVGRLSAWRLQEQGLKVALYEAADPAASESAAFVAAAMLAPLAEAAASEPLIGELGLAAMEAWPEIIDRLPIPVFLQRAGTLVVWHPSDQAEFTHFSGQLARQLPAQQGQVLHLDATGLAQKEPALAGRFKSALLLEGEGQLDNHGLLAALQSALEAGGTQCYWHSPREPRDVAETARLVLDCRGLGAVADMPGLRGIRGEVLRVVSQDVVLQRPVRLLHPRYPLYIAPKPNGVFVVGATEIESDDRSPPSVRSALELLSALYTVHPAFGEARIQTMLSGCRPTLPDHRPALFWRQKVCGTPILQVNGLYRHGFLLAPVVTEAACSWVAQALALGDAADTEAFAAWAQQLTFPALCPEVVV